MNGWKLYQLQRLFSVAWYKKGMMLGEIERIGEETVVVYFKALTCNSFGETE
jgi:hypothetical protein